MIRFSSRIGYLRLSMNNYNRFSNGYMNLSVSELFSLKTSNEYEILEGNTSSSRNTSYIESFFGSKTECL